jgi:uncharacterized protein (DUF1330 family)
MPKAYVVVSANITDPDLMKEYSKAAGPTLAPYEAKVLVVNNEAEVLEGSPPGRRVVVIEFASREKALAWYNDPAYAEPKGMRLRATDGHLVIVDGLG